jgi:formylmethanofuran dehydrogenase subunit B
MPEPRRHSEVVCPFCALACDDLEIEATGSSLRVVANGCPISEPAFAAPAGPGTPQVAGMPADLATAVTHAAELLKASRLPLLAGLGTDTAGARAALALAEATGGVLDHAGGAGLFANIRTLQDAGWVTATLAEARNRPDLIVFVGTDAAITPRLLQRLLGAGPRLAQPVPPALVALGPKAPPGHAVEHLACSEEALPLALAALEAGINGRSVTLSSAPGLSLATLATLAERLRRSAYSLIIWTAAELPGPHADLLVGRLASILRTLNATTRSVGLPLAGPDNVIGVNQVCAWQTGVPLRTSLASGAPDHDPWRYATEALLQDGSADCLLWLTSFRGIEPPGDLPSIVLGRAGWQPSRDVDVLIPVGTPGLDHAGSVYRTDSVVSLPVQCLRDIGLPPAAAVLDAIRARLASA